MPEVVGESRSAAGAAITAAHLKVSYTLVHSTEPKDLVVSTDPAAGTSVAAGSTVVARISLADEGTVPDVNGLTSQDSYNALAANGFTNITSAYTAASSSSQDNTVVSQSVAPNTIALHTTPITVTIAIAPQVTSLTITNVSPQCSAAGCTLVVDYTVQTNVPTSVTVYLNGNVVDANCNPYTFSTSDGPESAGSYESLVSTGAPGISEWGVQVTTSPSGPGQPVSSSGGRCGPT